MEEEREFAEGVAREGARGIAFGTVEGISAIADFINQLQAAHRQGQVGHSRGL